jgi:uncharacterized protein YndB with AHSA1/START domain
MTARQAAGQGYAAELAIDAPRWLVFEALTTLHGLTSWWASTATGSGSEAGSFELGFAGLDETITMRVDRAVVPSSVAWTCLSHTGLPDWDGTEIMFELTEDGADSTHLDFRHVGLVPELDCYERCHVGWDHFLASLAAYAAGRGGSPYGTGSQKAASATPV